MRRIQSFLAMIAVASAGALVLAQTPSGTSAAPAGQSTPTTQSGATQPSSSTTLVGCLYREADVPGRSPNIAERAGVLEDYILADASEGGAASAPRPTGTSGTAGAVPAAGKMFKIENIEDNRLSALAGKRVEVVGKIDAEADDVRGSGANAQPQADRNPGPDAIELPEFEATTIREVAGTCPAVPAR
jgi:hypothetical protein